MKSSRWPLAILALWFLAASVCEGGSLNEQLRQRLESPGEGGELVAAGEALYAVSALQALYLRRGWAPIWFENDDSGDAAIDRAIDALELARVHGLEPADYHRERLLELRERLATTHASELRRRLGVDLELLTSDALLTLALHLAHGRVDPETIDPEWFISREPATLLELLTQARRGHNTNIRGMLESLLPDHSEYRALVERLALHRHLARDAGWPVIANGPLLRPGEPDERVTAIRQRLERLGDLEQSGERETGAEADLYDQALERAVIAFQRRHGLEADGIVGPHTLAALNIQPQARIDQLRANLERWRWLPRDLGDEYIIVSIAGFGMRVVSANEIVMEQRVVVGAPYRRTPVFTGRMTYLVLNPSWEVPHKLAVEDQLPRIRNGIEYLDEMGFALLQGWGVDERLIDPATVDWTTLSSRNFPYRLRQAPGPKNALGRVKFMFPNPHNVYLHDTPNRGLFSQENRALSSGCIRLEQPDRLTRWLLSERSAIMDAERIDSIIGGGRETTVRLDRPLTVHLLYWTAWVDETGTVHYRNDIYQRDRRLIEALDTRAPRILH